MSTTSSFSIQTPHSEFTANSFTGGTQLAPQVLHLSNGGFVVAYNNHDALDGYIMLDFYDSNAHRVNASVRATYDSLANTSAANAPALVQLADGTVLVAWANNDPANLGIKAATFTVDGTKIGSEKTLVAGQYFNPHAVALPNGDTMLTYSDATHVYKRSFANFPYNVPVHVETQAGNSVSEPTSVVLANGGSAVAWIADPAGAAGPQLHARIYAADGSAALGEITLDNTDPSFTPSLAALHNGFFAVAYKDTSWANDGQSGISLVIVSPHGSPSNPIHVNTPNALADHSPSIDVLANGMLVVSWVKEVTPGNYDIYGRVFTEAGTPVPVGGHDEFLISSNADILSLPDVAALTSGRFVTAWSTTGAQDIGAEVSELVRTTTGDGAHDIYAGDELRDVINSGGGNDTIMAGDGNDVVDAGAGNDTIVEGRGADITDGGAGDDTVVFSNTFDHYVMMEYRGGIYVTGSDGTDWVKNVEHLKFADTTFHVTDDGNALFDTPYYMSHNHDVFFSGANALDHYNTFGWHEGRDPNPYFDTSGYLGTYKDVAASGQNPLEHYHQTGWHQGRDPSAYFDTTLYLVHNPDVAEAGVDPFEHWLAFGQGEGRHAYAAIGQTIVGGFDAEYYLFHNPDVAAAGVDPLQHYNTAGWHEGRNPNAYFDTSGYLAHYADVAAAGANPLQHYEQFGWHEGRDPSAQFDTLKYLAANPDVAAAGVNPLDHFLLNGIYEGRSPAGDGLWH